MHRKCMYLRVMRVYAYMYVICIRVYACMYVFGTSYVIDYLQRYFARRDSQRERFPTRIPAIDTNGPREFALLRVIYNVYTMNLELKFIH